MARNGKNAQDDGAELAYISPKVLKWALDRSTLQRDFVASKLKVNPTEISRWEQGTAIPTFDKARELAKIVHVPFGFFYLKNPPDITLPLPDFRGFNRAYKPSENLLDLLNDILVKQDWYRDYAKDSAMKTLAFVGSFGVSDSIVNVAASIRLKLSISQRLRQSVSSWAEYLATLTRQTEDAGILVMRSGVVANLTRRKLSLDELQGFAIADPIAPIVFVNSADFKASQIFTIAHELAHIWIGQTAIANADELGVARGKIENFCNRVAAEVLVPNDEYLNAWRHDSSDAQARVQHIAKQFWVSTLVSLRRAHELGQVSDEQFEKIKSDEQQRRRKLASGGGDYYRNIIARMGARLTNAVLTEINNGHLPLRDGAQLLGMKVPTLVKFAETWK